MSFQVVFMMGDLAVDVSARQMTSQVETRRVEMANSGGRSIFFSKEVGGVVAGLLIDKHACGIRSKVTLRLLFAGAVQGSFFTPPNPTNKIQWEGGRRRHFGRATRGLQT